VLSFVSFADRLFYANGNQFKKNMGFIGSGETNFSPTYGQGNFDVSLPPLIYNGSTGAYNYYTVPFSYTLIDSSAVLGSIAGAPAAYGFSGYISFSAAWENQDGSIGPE
jgi:hypothetical protein